MILRRVIDRTGEINYNNFGSKMEIIKYENNENIDVYFPQYNWIAKHKSYVEFKKKTIKCLYEPRVFNIAYVGDGKYVTKENNKQTASYSSWKDMLRRCYDSKYHKNQPTYVDCFVCNEWLNFQNFAKWYYENYYEIEGEVMCLDKDILIKGNKIYSPNTCVFVPKLINGLFTKRTKNRGNYPIGVSYNKRDKKFISQCCTYDYKERKTKSKNLGSYNTPEEAFEVYKEFKENYIKEVADYYKDKIPQRLYNAMYNYEIEIDD